MKRQGPGISPQQLSKENRRNIEPKETHSYLIPHLLVVFTQQHEILLTTRPMCHCSTSKQMKTITREAPGLGEVVRYELNKVYSFIPSFIHTVHNYLPFLNPFWLQPSVPQVLPFPCHKTEKQNNINMDINQQSTSKHF